MMGVSGSIEYFDALDENGNQTGRVKTKEDIIKDRNFYRIVNLWMVHPRTKQILIQKRSSNKEVSPNKWDLTAGGHVVAFETSLEAVIREAREELGIDIGDDDILKVLEIKYDKEKRYFIDVYLLEKDVDIHDLCLQADEVADAKYFSLEELIRAYDTFDDNFVHHSFFPAVVELIRSIYNIKVDSED